MLFAVVPNQGLADRLRRRMAPDVPIGSQSVRITLAPHNGADDAHAGCAGDIRDHMMDLQIHLSECFLGSLKKLLPADSLIRGDSRSAGAGHAGTQGAGSTGAVYYGVAQA